MTRSTNNVATKNKRRSILKITKGFRGRSKNCLRIAKEKAYKAMQYAYRDRRNRKRDLRVLWIQRINSAVRGFGITYSKFINMLSKAGIAINRKMLSEMALREPASVKSLIDSVMGSELEYVKG
jgi:large subunit ribosomal protein L20